MSSTSDVSKRWQQFFVAAGIPSKIGTSYAKLFVEQRIQLSMIDEIDKATLVDIGITAVGDQIAILRHIRKSRRNEDEEMDDVQPSREMKQRITGPSSETFGIRRGQVAPDRDDIYHVRMPSGTTPKTKEIMKKHDLLRSVGLLKRGSDGVRQSGREVLPVAEQRMLARFGKARGGTSSARATASSEVSSTTSDIYERLGVRGLVSDQMQTAGRKRIIAGRPKTTLQNSGRLSTSGFKQKPRSLTDLSEYDEEDFEMEDDDDGEFVEVLEEPVFRVQLSEDRAGPSSMGRRTGQRAVHNRLSRGVSLRGQRQLPNVKIRMNGRGGIQKHLQPAGGLYSSRASFANRGNRFEGGNNGAKRLSIFERLG